jgi:transcriptional regulator with XRE-family HTH domain
MRITAITKFKHGVLKEALDKLGWSQSELARRCGIAQSELGRIINLKKRPSEERALKIQRAFGDAGVFIDIEEAWPDGFEGIDIPEIKETREVDMQSIHLEFHRRQQLCEPSGISEEVTTGINSVLETLPSACQEVIRLRFEGNTLEYVANKLGVKRERVRVIEARGLRLLRHPVRIRKLEVYAQEIGIRTE